VSTSREALGLRGEQIVPVGSLPLGDSVELFVERAGAVRPDLDVVADREVIERICARLDGIPLAVELAAARCRSMTPADIDERLTDRFRLLRGGRDGAERHRTLQAAVAWSYSLLDDDERTVFDQLAVFAGGSLVDGVVAVTGLDEFDVLDVLDRLVARSMVVATRTPLGMRYHQLETLRQFAEDRLVEAGVIDEARARHLDWVRQLAVSIFLSGGTPRGGDGFRRFCAEVDNLRVAVAHATTIGRHSVAHEIVASLSTYAYYRPLYELLDWVRPIQLEDGWTDMAAVCAVWGVANDALRAGHTDLDLSGGVPAEVIVRSPAAWLSYAYNQILLPGGGWQAALETLASMPADGGRFGAAVDQLWLLAQYFRQLGGGPHSMLGDDEFAELRRRGGAAVELARRQGDELVYAVSLGQLALALEVRFPAEAMELAQESAAVAEQLGADAWRATVLGVYHRCNAQTVARNGADSPEAMRLLRDAIVATLDNEGALRAGVLTVAAFTYIAHADPDVAILFIARWRQASDVNVDAYLVRAGIPVPSDWGEWERRTARQSLADLTGAVLAALDRVIAAAEAASSTEGAG
jgi:hypothetical protein